MKKYTLILVLLGLMMKLSSQPVYLHRANQDVYVNGINLAWINFANDLGSGFDQADFTTAMQQIRAAGGNSTRWWIHVDGTNNPVYTNDSVSGWGTNQLSTLKTALDIAIENGILVSVCLWSFDMLQAANSSRTADVIARNQLMLTDSLYTVAYIRNALIPMIKLLKNHPAVLCWEVFNEPEGMSTQFGWTPTKVDMKYIQRFINMVAGAIHREAPNAKVSNGSWSFNASTDVGSTHKNYYSKAQLIAAGKDTAGYLDFYQVHYYPQNFTINESPFYYPASHWGLDKPIVIGEFPAIGITEKNGTKYTPVQAYEKLYNTGYAGALSWTYGNKPGGPNSGDKNGALSDCDTALLTIENLDYSHVVIVTPGINMTPTVKMKLPEGMAYFGSSDTITIDSLSRYFNDEDVPGLTYKVDSANAYAYFINSGGLLKVVPKLDSAGIASINITATDTGGKSVIAPFIFALIDSTSANIFKFRNIYSSSVQSNDYLPCKADDNTRATRWASTLGLDNQWLLVKMDTIRPIQRMMIQWEAAYAQKYSVDVSTDSVNWQTVYSEVRGDGGYDKLIFDSVNTKYVRLNCIKRRPDENWGFSIYEIQGFSDKGTNSPPTIVTSITDQTAIAYIPFSLTIPTSTATDPDLGDRLTYEIKMENGSSLPSWLTFSDTTLMLSGTPDNSDIGVYNLKLKVKDLFGASDSCSFNLTVGINHAPTISAPIADQIAIVAEQFSLTVPLATATDIDQGDKLTYTCKLSDGSNLPSWLTFSTSTRILTGIPVIKDTGTYHMSVIAKDLSGQQANSTFVLTVLQYPVEIAFANKINSLKVYPNPAKNYLKISLESSDISSVKLFIVDISGKVIFTNIVQLSKYTNDLDLDISSIKSGTYLLRIISKNNQMSKTIQIIK